MTTVATHGLTAFAVEGARVQWDLALWEQEFADGYRERPCRTSVRPRPPAPAGTLHRYHRPYTRLRSVPTRRLELKRPWPTQRSPPAYRG